jgi:glycosyltransferase involved in cell wall biosynthesis
MRPRFHARFPGALCENVGALGPHARLAAWRVEPVRTIDGPRHQLDLTFANGAEIAVVAGIVLDVHGLAHRDRSPFVVPRDALGAAESLGDVCDALRPQLESMFTETVDPADSLHEVAGVADRAIAARRESAALGAVRYAAVARARGRDVADGAYVETCFAGPVPRTPAAPAVTFGERSAALRCYVAVSDDALTGGAAAYRCALALAEALGGEDLAVDVAGYDGRPLDAYAFVHAVGIDDPHAVAELIATARARGIRTLITPLFDDPVNGGFWGARTHARALSLADGGDEEMLASLGRFVVDRKVSLEEGLLPNKPWEPRPGYREAQRRALALADAVFVSCAAEAQRIKALCGERSFAAYVPSPHDVAPADPAAEPYVLAVAPVGPLHGSATLARAAARVGFPVRFAGSVLDGAYAARALSYLDDRSSLAPGDPGTGARVVVDVSWSGTDLSSLAAYAVHGVPVIGSNRSDVRDVLGARGVWAVDPADESALAAALSDAWNGAAAHAAALAEHARARCRIDVLRACLASAYLVPEPAA